MKHISSPNACQPDGSIQLIINTAYSALEAYVKQIRKDSIYKGKANTNLLDKFLPFCTIAKGSTATQFMIDISKMTILLHAVNMWYENQNCICALTSNYSLYSGCLDVVFIALNSVIVWKGASEDICLKYVRTDRRQIGHHHIITTR